jgi:transcription-repair coupling factor (superfamily II helicase)
VRLQRLYPKSLVKDAVETMLVPRPATAPIGGKPLRDVELLDWARRVIDDILLRTAVGAG